jgi:hypothetical protein
MFEIVSHFPLAGKARSLPLEWSLTRALIMVCSSLAQILDNLTKHTNLLQYKINYGCKEFVIQVP